MRVLDRTQALALICSLLFAVVIVQAQSTNQPQSNSSQAPNSSGSSNAPQPTGNNTTPANGNGNGNGTTSGNSTNTNATQTTTTQANFPTAPVFTTGALAGTQAAPAPAGTAGTGSNAVGPNDGYIAAANRLYAAAGISTVALLGAGTWLIL
ncbi:hypothetical protein CBOM_02525 [Ceraceosorus bombacis]|uniref:Uncharacterized protein n=1 Tax=Ceraceosorus bombacis TaxID=401625 RepID=A0A0P1BEV3_9BASI|nr:hypothetical protein CBOM_02525 [Ceraceosorus bombacis]